MALNTVILPYNKIEEVEENGPISPPNSELFEESNENHSFEMFPKSYNDYSIDNNIIQKTFFTPTCELKFNLSKFPTNCIFDANKQFEKTPRNQIKLQKNNIKKPCIFRKKFPVYQMNKQKNSSSSSSFININKININSINNNTINNNNSNLKSPSMRNNKDDNGVSNILSDNFNDPRLLSREKGDLRLYNFKPNDCNFLDNSGSNNNFSSTINHNSNTNLISNFNIIYATPNIYENRNDLYEKKTTKKKNSGLLIRKFDILSLKRKTSLNKNNKINIFPFNTVNLKNNDRNKLFLSNTKSEDDFKQFNSDSIDEQININKSNTSRENYNVIRKNLRGCHKKKFIKLHIYQIRKIMKNGSFFNVLRFLEYFDIINLLQTNRKIRNIVNKVISDIYYFRVKENLKKYKDILELLKCTLVYSNIKDTLKIDLVLNIAFTLKQFNFFRPYYIQLVYIYDYYQKIKLKKLLITKEEQEKMDEASKMYDHYTFDLFYEGNQKYFLMEELSLFPKDNTDKILYIQPILPFKINDRGIINLEIYTTNNNFIDPFSIEIILIFYELENYLNTLKSRGLNNPRICEYELSNKHWMNIEFSLKFAKLKNEIINLFKPCFEIKNFYFQNIGVNIIKVILLAVKQGEIDESKQLRVKIVVKDKNDYIENEIRKNNLLFERRDVFELRVGDEITYYFTTKFNI